MEIFLLTEYFSTKHTISQYQHCCDSASCGERDSHTMLIVSTSSKCDTAFIQTVMEYIVHTNSFTTGLGLHHCQETHQPFLERSLARVDL